MRDRNAGLYTLPERVDPPPLLSFHDVLHARSKTIEVLCAFLHVKHILGSGLLA